MNALKKWMAAATPKERTTLARLAKTSVGNLRQTAGGYRTQGKLSTSPELARRLEIASEKVQREGLGLLSREDLCQACGRCEYAKMAKKARG